MDAIDALIAARVTKPASIASGEVPVWNGTTWVRSGDGVGTGIAIAALHGYPGDGTKALLGDGSWGALGTYARQNASVAATNTTTETDLLSFTLGANALGSTKMMRITASGDSHFGASQAGPRLKFKMGSGPTVIIDTGTVGGTIASSANRADWEIVVTMIANNATNAQFVTFRFWLSQPGVAGTGAASSFTTGQGVCSMPVAAAAGTVIEAKGGNSATIDTTSSQTTAISVINGSATSTDFTMKDAIVEVL